MNTKIIASILVASIVAMAMVVPMAMGDEATQEVTVTQVGALTIVNATDLTSDVTAINFGSGAPGDALRPTPTGVNATFALMNTYNDNVVVGLSATDFVGTEHSGIITQSAEYELLADSDAATTDGQISNQLPQTNAGSMGPGHTTPTYKYTWLKLVLPGGATADSYSGSTLTVTATLT